MCWRHWRVADPRDRLKAHVASLELIRPHGLEHIVPGGGVRGCLVQTAVEMKYSVNYSRWQGYVTVIAYTNSPSFAMRAVTLNVSSVSLPVEGRGNNPEARIAAVRFAATLRRLVNGNGRKKNG
jgi:hypothetical protein